jgi:hypothetical protein
MAPEITASSSTTKIFISITRGVAALPAPGVAAHVGEGVSGLPAEDVFRLGGVGVDGGEVARAARADHVGDGHAVDLGEGLDHVEHAVADAGAEVEDLAARVVIGVVDGGEVAVGQVADVDVVAHAGAVGRVVVVAEDGQARQLADRDLRDVGHEVVGDAVRVLADEAGLVRAHGVEVAQQHDAEAGVGLAGAHEDLLDHELRPAVGVRAAAGLRGLREGRGLVAVDRRGGGEHELMAAEAGHRLEHGHGRVEIRAVVQKGLGHRLAHGLEPGEVDDARDVVFAEDLLHRGAVAHVGLDAAGLFPRDLLQALEHARRAVAEVVGQKHVAARQLHGDACVAADVPGTAGQKNGHGKNLPVQDRWPRPESGGKEPARPPGMTESLDNLRVL